MFQIYITQRLKKKKKSADRNLITKINQILTFNRNMEDPIRPGDIFFEDLRNSVAQDEQKITLRIGHTVLVFSSAKVRWRGKRRLSWR